MRSSASCTSSTECVGAAGDFRDAPFAQRLHELVDDAVFEGVLLAQAFELEHQAFPQIAGADAGRVEGLNHFEHRRDLLRRQHRWPRPVPPRSP